MYKHHLDLRNRKSPAPSKGRTLFLTGQNEEWKDRPGHAILNDKNLKEGYEYGLGEDPCSL